MTDFKKRFRERFLDREGSLINSKNLTRSGTTAENILAFIEEELNKNTHEAYELGWDHGQSEERQRIVELVEKYFKGLIHISAPLLTKENLLTKIRTEETDHQWTDEATNRPELTKSGFQEETECCESGNFGDHHLCRKQPGHKPRTEETEKPFPFDAIMRAIPAVAARVEETEKEGASFSGRDGDGFCQHGMSEDNCHVKTCSHAPKETPTPQSREQGGENNYRSGYGDAMKAVLEELTRLRTLVGRDKSYRHAISEVREFVKKREKTNQ